MIDATKTTILLTDRNFVEIMKRRLKLKTNYETIHELFKEIRKHKLHLDMGANK